METIEKVVNMKSIDIIQRAEYVLKYGNIHNAVLKHPSIKYSDISLSEALLLGLINQNVRKFISVFGHGSTDLAEVLRIYENMKVVRTFSVHSEIEASHAASALRWQYNERSAVITSIGPGAMQAFAASIMPKSNCLGVYYIFGDETSHSEGPNMQQIPKRTQDLFLTLGNTMSEAFTLTEPWAIATALKRGYQTTYSQREAPFFFFMPLNKQPVKLEKFNLSELPYYENPIPKQIFTDKTYIEKAISLIEKYDKVLIKIGGGAKNVSQKLMKQFAEKTSSAFVHGPNVPGYLPYSHPQNMTVGGSKGSIAGNFAMNNCELLIIIGARGVCQWDSSGTAWKNVKQVININVSEKDIAQYNKTLPLLGDAEEIIKLLIKNTKQKQSVWLKECLKKKEEWDIFKNERYKTPVIFDKKFGKELLTQPAAIKEACDFAKKHKAVKIFDAGDVQANGFQIVEDDAPYQTFTDTGSSYMGFAVSSLLASAISEKKTYSIAFTGDGSFLMNPQILSDGAEYKLRAMIIIFDNRRMGAISSLQHAQYKIDFKTDDKVAVDYVKIANSFEGVKGFFGGYSIDEFKSAMKKAYSHHGLSVLHVPVYFGENILGGLGAFGNWNVGNWCQEVQEEKHKIGL